MTIPKTHLHTKARHMSHDHKVVPRWLYELEDSVISYGHRTLL